MSKWIWLEDYDTFKCSECSFWWNDITDGIFDEEELDIEEYGVNYCPHCGADMRGDSDGRND